MNQPEALRLAEIWEDYLPAYNYKQVALDTSAELRRLHAENIAAVSSFLSADDERTKMRAQRDALLEALQLIAAYMNDPMSVQMTRQQFAEKARAAIAKARGEK